MPPAKMRGDGRKAKNPKKTLLRLLSYLKHYTPTLILVILCVFATAFASIRGSTALGDLVDDFILPMVATGSSDFSALTRFAVTIGCIFAVGVVASFFQSYLMVSVTQGIQKHVRDEMFRKMQTLPLRYFDGNTAGNGSITGNGDPRSNRSTTGNKGSGSNVGPTGSRSSATG